MERSYGTWQNRLPQELRLADISTLEQANAFLRERYIAEFNQQFRVAGRRNRCGAGRCFLLSALPIGRVIVASAAIDPVVRHSHVERLLQTERQQRFGRNSYAPAPGKELRANSRSRPRGCADGSTLSPARNRANYGARSPQPPQKFTCPRILPKTVPLPACDAIRIRC